MLIYLDKLFHPSNIHEIIISLLKKLLEVVMPIFYQG